MNSLKFYSPVLAYAAYTSSLAGKPYGPNAAEACKVWEIDVHS